MTIRNDRINAERWADLVNANEEHTLTLTLDQRNSIGEVNDYMEWLEDQLEDARQRINELSEELAETSEELTGVGCAAEEVLQAIDYATLLKKPRWVREWLLGSDNRHPEHAAISKLRNLIRGTRAAQPPSDADLTAATIDKYGDAAF